MVEKVVKETFKPDEKIEKKSDKVIEEEPRGGVFVPDTDEFGRGAIINKDYKRKK